MNRIQRSWHLGKLSWKVLRSDHTLAVFPVITAVGALVVLLVFGGLIALTGIDDAGNQTSLAPIGWVLVVLMYLVEGFVVTFFQAALVCSANARLDARETRFGSAVSDAAQQFPAIAGWAVLQTTVSLVLQAIEDRSSALGQILAGLFGAAWRTVTFLAVPIVVLEGAGPLAALKRSGALLRQTWGENLAGQFGFGLLGLVASIPGLVCIGLAIAAGAWAVSVPLGIVAAVWLLAVAVVLSAMTGIYKTALYRYAVDGHAPAGFATDDLREAFASRPR